MLESWQDTLRFFRGFVRPASDLRTREFTLDPEGHGDPTSATLIEPPDTGQRVGWVVLHGLTRPGRAHPALVRFTRALASTGGRVLVPEIAEWMEMDFAPQRAQAIIRGAVHRLAEDPRSRPGGVILVGFSFGAPQALLVGADPGLKGTLRGVVGWGGFADLRRTTLFQFTGDHEWKGQAHHFPPDPYGRWIVGSNCLRLDTPLGDAIPVADALRTLAIDAGERQVVAWDPVYEGLKRHLRRGLPRRLRPLYDIFAPPGNDDPEPEEARAVVDAIVPAARRDIPLIEPLRAIEAIEVPVRLLHPRADHLIPYTETLRLADALAGRAPDMEMAITGLLGHSGRGAAERPLRWARETTRLLRAFRGIFALGGKDD